MMTINHWEGGSTIKRIIKLSIVFSIGLIFLCVLLLVIVPNIKTIDNDAVVQPACDGDSAVTDEMPNINVNTSSEDEQPDEEFASDGCRIHAGFYHSIDNRLIDYVGTEKMDAFIERYGYEEDNNIVNFVNFCGISKETFVTLIDRFQLNATSSYSGGNGYDADIIYSGDDTVIQQYYARPKDSSK